MDWVASHSPFQKDCVYYRGANTLERLILLQFLLSGTACRYVITVFNEVLVIKLYHFVGVLHVFCIPKVPATSLKNILDPPAHA